MMGADIINITYLLVYNT